MTISTSTTPTSPAGTEAATRSATTSKTAQSALAALDGNSFLQLLIAQLKNQDPTNPVDATQYASQLAQYANVEQSVKTNSLLDGLITTSALSQAEGLIGRTVTNADNTVSGEIVSVKVLSDGSIATLKDGRDVKLVDGVKIS